jgi:hypothetical protein
MFLHRAANGGGNGRAQTGQYTMLRKPMRKDWGFTPSLITIMRGFVRTIVGTWWKDEWCECVWFKSETRYDLA